MEKSEKKSAFKRFFAALAGRAEESAESSRAERAGTAIHKMLMHNIVLKIVALVLAVLAWSFIVAETDPVVKKSYTDVGVILTGTEQLLENGYILKDETDAVRKRTGTVYLDINFNTALHTDASDIQIICDVSEVASPGSNRVRLKAQSAKGTVLSVSPEYLTLEFDRYAETEVPVSYICSGTLADDKAIDTPMLSVSTIKLGGPEEYIRNVVRADVEIDLSHINARMFPAALPFVLRDLSGVAVTVPNIVRYNTAVTVFMNVYAKKTVPIDVTPNLANYGKLAEGFEITDVSLYPKKVTIIGEEEIVSSVGNINLKDYIDLAGQSRTVSGSYALDIPAGITVLDGETTAYVSVDISERYLPVDFEEVRVMLYDNGLPRDAVCSVETVHITGEMLYSYAKNLEGKDLVAYVDLADDHVDGTRRYDIHCRSLLYPDTEMSQYVRNLTVTPDKAEVTVTPEDPDYPGGKN
ncbi:MAG: hypothetical protein KIG36_02670 [Eubacteriales bacterium]|nr:hypothetical protein [Eubacteriales bacterium]